MGKHRNKKSKFYGGYGKRMGMSRHRTSGFPQKSPREKFFLMLEARKNDRPDKQNCFESVTSLFHIERKPQ
jgi:hypothetical protein